MAQDEGTSNRGSRARAAAAATRRPRAPPRPGSAPHPAAPASPRCSPAARMRQGRDQRCGAANRRKPRHQRSCSVQRAAAAHRTAAVRPVPHSVGAPRCIPSLQHPSASSWTAQAAHDPCLSPLAAATRRSGATLRSHAKTQLWLIIIFSRTSLKVLSCEPERRNSAGALFARRAPAHANAAMPNFAASLQHPVPSNSSSCTARAQRRVIAVGHKRRNMSRIISSGQRPCPERRTRL